MLEHGLCRAVTLAQQKFKPIIEARRIADPILQQANSFGEFELTQQLGRLRAQPTPVGADGVDLAIVSYEPEWLSQGPTGLGIGGVTLMKDRECTFELAVAQIRVKLRQLRRRQQALIDDGA